MELAAGRKGIFFISLVLVLVTIFFFSSFIYIGAQERTAVQNRVKTMNNFLFSTQQDLQRQVYVSGYRIIFLLEKQVAQTGAYVPSLSTSVNEAFYNGTINSVPQELMIGATFFNISDSLYNKARMFNINLTLVKPNFTLSQDNPWQVKAVLSGRLIMEDMGGQASWNTTLNITAYIPIDGFEDPLYMVKTESHVSHILGRTPYVNFAQGSDVTNLSSQVFGGYYIASTSAPSFLNRLRGDMTASPVGIESLVDLTKLSNEGIPVLDNVSVVDYLYFAGSSVTSYKITGMPSWFRIDNSSNHLALYGVSGLATP